jgi:phage tail P2-like protein
MVVSLSKAVSGPVLAAFDAVLDARLSNLDAKLAEVFDPERCPAGLLAWLAYHYGVDVWSSAWTESQKRAAVRDAYDNFRRRGTRSGMEAALSNFVAEVLLLEWWQSAAAPGTFDVLVTGDATSTSTEAQDALAEIVARTAPYTRTFTITVTTEIDVAAVAAPALRVAKILTVDSKAPAVWPLVG